MLVQCECEGRQRSCTLTVGAYYTKVPRGIIRTLKIQIDIYLDM